MRKRDEPHFGPARHPIQIKVDGAPYEGIYFLSDGMITVEFGLESETTQIGGSTSSAAQLALGRQILSGMVRKHLASGAPLFG